MWNFVIRYLLRNSLITATSIKIIYHYSCFYQNCYHILVNQGLANLAFAGVEVNMVLFAKSVLRQTNAEASNTFSRWMGSLYLSSLMGAFLSDSYLGRYLTCVTFQAFSIIVSKIHS